MDLHWVPIRYRINYKTNLLTYKCLKGTAPSYLCDLIEEYAPSRSLRSSNKHLLKEKLARSKTYGERAFSVCAPKLWNQLPLDLRCIDTIESFKKVLKTFYFKQA
jgi:hypothetical protein